MAIAAAKLNTIDEPTVVAGADGQKRETRTTDLFGAAVTRTIRILFVSWLIAGAILWWLR